MLEQNRSRNRNLKLLKDQKQPNLDKEAAEVNDTNNFTNHANRSLSAFEHLYSRPKSNAIVIQEGVLMSNSSKNRQSPSPSASKLENLSVSRHSKNSMKHSGVKPNFKRIKNPKFAKVKMTVASKENQSPAGSINSFSKYHIQQSGGEYLAKEYCRDKSAKLENSQCRISKENFR